MAVVAGAALVLAVGSQGRTIRAAGRIQTTQACSATFADRAGDAITSDGGGAYFNGVAGVQCEVFEGGSGDITLYLTASGKHATRFIQFDHTNRIQGTGPEGILDDLSTQAGFQKVATLSAEGNGSFTGGFTTTIGRFAFNSTNYPAASDLNVTRTSQTDWTIEADAGINDTAVLAQSGRKGAVITSEYLMPFQLDVHCPSCS